MAEESSPRQAVDLSHSGPIAPGLSAMELLRGLVDVLWMSFHAHSLSRLRKTFLSRFPVVVGWRSGLKRTPKKV